jgi:thiamine-phosphate pyrophosphorylase
VSLLNNSGSRSNPLLCYVTDRRSLPGVAPEAWFSALVRKIEQVASAGVDWVQIREKDLSARELAALTRQILWSTAASSKRRGVRILVNDRLDVALAEHAGGVHLGEKSLPVQEAKRLVQSSSLQGSASGDFLFGVSCHSLEARKASAPITFSSARFLPRLPKLRSARRKAWTAWRKSAAPWPFP